MNDELREKLREKQFGQSTILPLPVEKLQSNDERRSRVQNVCSALNITERLRNKYGCLGKDCPIYVFKTEELAYCLLRKVGSSSFSNDMLKIEGLSDNGGVRVYKIIDDNFERLSPTSFRSSKFKKHLTFIFVRHPFTRLVSNFKDKADCDPNARQCVSFYKNYFHDIMRRYRNNSDVTPSSRLTFREFVLYLIETPIGNFNDHWIPYWFSCEPCYMNYDFIGKIESFNEDREFLFKQLGLYERVDKFQQTNKKSCSSDKESYFSQLTKSEIEKLYLKYKYDFELFDYSPDDYYQYAKID